MALRQSGVVFPTTAHNQEPHRGSDHDAALSLFVTEPCGDRREGLSPSLSLQPSVKSVSSVSASCDVLQRRQVPNFDV